MSKDEAELEADKRNHNKSKFMSDRLWRVDHESTRGWHVRLGWTVETKWKKPA